MPKIVPSLLPPLWAAHPIGLRTAPDIAHSSPETQMNSCVSL
jgi:hypothetical protein